MSDPTTTPTPTEAHHDTPPVVDYDQAWGAVESNIFLSDDAKIEVQTILDGLARPATFPPQPGPPASRSAVIADTVQAHITNYDEERRDASCECGWRVTAHPDWQAEVRADHVAAEIDAVLAALPAPVVSGDDPLRVEVCRLLAEFADITKRREITLGYIESRLAGAVTVADAPAVDDEGGRE